MRDEIIKNYENHKSNPKTDGLCEGDLKLISNWKWDTNITLATDGVLTEQGWRDLIDLAKRYQRTFPNIVGDTFDSSKYLIRSTVEHRMVDSYKAFIDGLYGVDAHKTIGPTSNETPREMEAIIRVKSQ